MAWSLGSSRLSKPPDMGKGEAAIHVTRSETGTPLVTEGIQPSPEEEG